MVRIVGLIQEDMFQSLIGRLQTKDSPPFGYPIVGFQSLIGRLQT